MTRKNPYNFYTVVSTPVSVNVHEELTSELIVGLPMAAMDLKNTMHISPLSRWKPSQWLNSTITVPTP